MTGANFDAVYFDDTLIGPICEGSLGRVDEQGLIMFVNPAMQFSRSRLTVRFSDDDGQTWDRSLLIADKMSDYSVLVQGALLNDASTLAGETEAGAVSDKAGGMYGGVLWGSCDYPMPWRVWCNSDFKWTIYFTRFPLTRDHSSSARDDGQDSVMTVLRGEAIN